MIITKKLELRVDTEDKELKAKVWAYLRQLTRDICTAANKAMSHRYFMEEAVDKLIKPDLEAIEVLEAKISELEVAYKSSDLKKAEAKKLEEQIAKTKKDLYKLNSDARIKAREEFGKLSMAGEEGKENGMTLSGLTYRFLKVAELPGTVLDSLSVKVNQDFNNDQKDVTLGKRTIRTYKSEIIYFRFRSVKNMTEEGFEWLTLPTGETIKFAIVYGKDKSAKNDKKQDILSDTKIYSIRDFVKRCLDGTYKISDGQSIKIEDKKIFWNMSVDVPKFETNKTISKTKAIGVHISFMMPVAMITADGLQVRRLGDNRDFVERRKQFDARLSRKQSRLRMVASGTGRGKINKGLERFKDLERNFVDTYNFKLAKEVVMFALKNNCGLINMVDLSDVSNLVDESEVLRYWSYYDLQTKIENKAKQYGIEVKKNSPIGIYTEFLEELRNPEAKKPETEIELVSKFLSRRIDKINYNYVKKIANSFVFNE